MKHGPTTWAGLILLGAAVEAVALRGKHHDHTLSHATRAFFCTHTPLGGAAFVAGWIALTLWFPSHILIVAEGSSS